MKRTFYRYLLVAIAAMTLASCYKEDPIIPSEHVDKLFFDFPQGNASYDREIQQLQETYGTYIIYKDIPNSMLNRAWVNVYIGSYIDADPVPEKLIPWYVDFVKRGVFRYFDPEKFSQFFPKYFFLVSNMHMVLDGVSKPHMATKVDGVDFWALSFQTTESGSLYLPDEHLARICFAYKLVENMLKAGQIVIPATFYEGVDYSEIVYDDVNNHDKLNSKFHYQTRGFVKYVQPSFEYDSPLTNIQLAKASNEDFLMYVRKILYSPTAEFMAENGAYPLVMKRYGIVLDIFAKLGIDLAAISDGK